VKSWDVCLHSIVDLVKDQHTPIVREFRGIVREWQIKRDIRVRTSLAATHVFRLGETWAGWGLIPVVFPPEMTGHPLLVSCCLFFAASQASFRVGPTIALLVESLACGDRERLEADYAFLRDHLYTGLLSMLCVHFFVFLMAGGTVCVFVFITILQDLVQSCLTAHWCRRLAVEMFFVG